MSSAAPATVVSLPAAATARLARLIEERVGLCFPEERRHDMERGLLQAFALSTCNDLDEYYDLLRHPQDGALEMDRLINALTVGETYFFRDAGQFDALYRHVLPEIVERRRPIRTLRLWSAGCASGEEPYSLAMLLRELLPDVEDWSITILGTDINSGALERAQRAVYGEWAFRERLAREWRPRYFRPRTGRYELVPEVRRMVTFAPLNLAGAGYPSFDTNTAAFDLILCRNVTMYFSQATTQAVVQRLHDALVEGGWLVVGYAEASLTTYRRFQACNFPGAVLYRREAEPPGQPPARDWTMRDSRPAPASPTPVILFAAGPPIPLAARPAPPPLSAASPLERASELLEYGRSEEARDLLLEAVSRRQGDAPAYALLARAYANLGQWSEAEHWCRHAVQADRLALDAYYTLALVLQHEGRLAEAIEAMRKVVYIDRNNLLGHFGLAELYHDTGQGARALKALENARRLLDTLAAGDVIPGSGGITAGRLRETAIRQQQLWLPRR